MQSPWSTAQRAASAAPVALPIRAGGASQVWSMTSASQTSAAWTS